MQAPRIGKITVHMGVGDAKQDSKMLEAGPSSSRRSTGQKAERPSRAE